MNERTERIDVIEVKERIAVGEQLTPLQRDFVLDCINEATKPPSIIDDLRTALALGIEREAAQAIEIERLRADLDLRNQTACDRKEIIRGLEVKLAEVADFLAALPERIYRINDAAFPNADPPEKIAADCRARASKLRG